MNVKAYRGITTSYGHLFCAIDTETTGLEPGYHEILQLAIQPLDENFEPYEGILPFYTELKPDYPERATKKSLQVNGMDLLHLHQYGIPQEKCQDMLLDWFQNLSLSSTRRLIPVAHNWPFDYSFLTCWLGPELMSEIFSVHYRDTMELAVLLSDAMAMHGMTPLYSRFNLVSLCSAFGIPYSPETHDALEDSLATAKLFPMLIRKLYQCLN